VVENGNGFAGGLVLDPAVRILADQFFLLRVDADHRLAVGNEASRSGVQVLELGISVRMIGQFFGLRRCLQREPESFQQAPDGVVGHGESFGHQFLGQLRRRLGGPSQ